MEVEKKLTIIDGTDIMMVFKSSSDQTAELLDITSPMKTPLAGIELESLEDAVSVWRHSRMGVATRRQSGIGNDAYLI